MMHNKSTFPPAGTARLASGAATAVRAAYSGETIGVGHSVPAILSRLVDGSLLFLIQLYRWIFSPAQIFLFGAGSGCRFTPTCSQYATGAIRHHGAVAGGILALKRICRCHPLGDCGFDPVPESNHGSQCSKERRG